MRPPTPLPKRARRELEELLEKAQNIGQRRMILTCLLRAKHEWPAEKIAEEVGLSTGRVRHIHATYLKEGKTALVGKTWGGPVRNAMTMEEERRFLKKFEQAAAKGELGLIRQVHEAYNESTHKQVHAQTIYRLLKRHGWRKVQPRPRHPKTDGQAQEDFKKNSARYTWRPPQKAKASQSG